MATAAGLSRNSPGNFHNLSAKWIFRIELALHTKAGYLPYWLRVWTNLTRHCQNVLFHTSVFKLEVAEGSNLKIVLLLWRGVLNQQLSSGISPSLPTITQGLVPSCTILCASVLMWSRTAFPSHTKCYYIQSVIYNGGGPIPGPSCRL